MAKYCPNCGAELVEEAKFCGSCGYKFEQMPQQPQQPEQPIQPQGYMPPATPGKSSKMMKGIIALIVIIVIVVIVIFIFTSGVTNTSPLVGTWDSSFAEYSMKLNGDYSVEVGSVGYFVRIGTWSIQGNQLCMTYDTQWGSLGLGTQCGDYTLSEDGQTLTWQYSTYTRG